jgi:2-oxoglutarate dehydrogenase E1 component
VLCSGKVYHRLAETRAADGLEGIALVRLEQLYPFPADDLREVLEKSPDAELVWCQEEPRNMGAWPYLLQRGADLGIAMRYAGRPDSSSPATGSYRRHLAEEEHMVRRALGS